MKVEWIALSKKYPGQENYEFYKEAFRPGNCHYYEGVIFATELIKEGLGKIGPFEIPEFLSQKTAAAYKIMSLEGYLNGQGMGDARHLYELGFTPTKPVDIPKGWTEDRFKMAKLKLNLNFLHINLTEEQHASGARFAMEKIKNWASARTCKELDLRDK